MPSTVLDAPRVAAPPAVPVCPPAPAGTAPTARIDTRRRTPLPVAAAGALCVLEALGLLALGLTSLDSIFGTALRPSGALVAVTLLLLAGWVVLAAGGGASLVDGAGRQLIVAVAWGEVAVLAVLLVAALCGADAATLVGGGLPLPVVTLLGLAVPAVKLLLAASPEAVAWVAAGPRPRARRPALPPERRLLRGVTVAVIGVVLTGVAVLGQPAAPAPAPHPAAVDATP